MTAPAKTETYNRVYAEFLQNAQDPAWRFAMEVFLGEYLQQNAVYHQAQIQSICDWAAERQLNRHKVGITKRYLEERLSEVRKERKHQGFRDWGTPPKPTARPSNYDGFTETMWVRDHGGRFARFVGPQHVVDHFETKYRRTKDGAPVAGHERGVKETDTFADPRSVISRGIAMRPAKEREHALSNYGLLNRPEELPAGVSQSQHQVDVAHKFDTMTWALAQKTGNSEDKQRVQFVVTSPDGYHRVVTPKAGEMPDVHFKNGERVSFMTPVGPDNPVTIAGKAVNIGHIAGMSPEQAAKTGAVAGDVHGALTKTSWGDKMTHTSNALRVMSNDSPLATQAHAVASLFNILGPDASRAFGNKLKQLTYRYLGQESPADRYSEVAKRGRMVKSDGTMQSTRDYERQLAFDLAPAIPSATEYNAALQAGSSPPSRGYILNSDGRVVSEAVGYADDWYSPFNLRKLPQMRGGSYIRTRGYGGLTPEDIRLAMRTGATRATVISNNGVFTMEFEPKALHWGHRFGFAGNGMIKRYAKALDAIQNGAVEQADGPGGKLALNADGYKVAMADLQRKNPYWIKPDATSAPFHQSLREFGNIDRAEVTGDGAKDKGYVGPLDLHAKNSVATWHDPNVRELWSEGLENGRIYKWSDIDKGRIHHDLGLGLAGRLNGNGKGDSSGALGSSSYSMGNGSSSSNGSSMASATGRLGSNGVREGYARVGADGIPRNWKGEWVDHTGKKLDNSSAYRWKAEIRGSNPEFTRSGHVFKLTDQSYSSRPTGEPTKTTPADRESTYADELRSKSGHWSEDDALAHGQDVRDHLRRMKDKGLLPKDPSKWRGLGLAHKALIAPGDGYTNTTEYADFIQRLRTSPTYRKELAADIEDSVDGQHLSDELTQLEPGQLLATLRGQEYDPKAAPAKTEPRPDETGDNYASLDLNGERPVLPAELESSKFVQSHVRKLEQQARHDETAKRHFDEFRTYNKLTRKIADMRGSDEKAGRPIRDLDTIFEKEPGGMRELYTRLNRQYSAMIQHGTAVELENTPEREILRGETVPSTTHVKEGTGTSRSTLPHFDDLVAGRVEATDAGEAIFDRLHSEHGHDPHQLRTAIRATAKLYDTAAATQYRNGNKEAGDRLVDVAHHLRGYDS